MKVIILCGGMGTRLREETEFKPKPMINIGMKPILWHIMKIYAYYGFNEFILALGYKGDVIRRYLSDGNNFNCSLKISSSPETYDIADKSTGRDKFIVTAIDTGPETLPGERIRQCLNYIKPADTDFMVTYGDGVADINISKLYKFHKLKGALATITGVHPRTKYGLVYKNRAGRVTRFTEKPVLKQWISGGFMVFRKESSVFFSEYDWELDVLRKLTAENNLALYQHRGFWFAVDTYKEYLDLNNIWENGDAPWALWEK